MYVLAVNTFLGALLSFLLQPLIARSILPWFGGASAVWITAMMFFQCTLLAGYGYTHLLATRLALRGQVLLHLVLLGLSLLLLPVMPAESWQPAGAEDPRWRILLLLTVTVGLPFLLLTSTAPLMQSWLARLDSQREPYAIYALSNTGSMLGLLGYPLLVEPLFGVRQQAQLRSLGFAVFVLTSAWAGRRILRDTPAARDEVQAGGRNESTDAVPRERVLAWTLLSANAVIVLLASTNQLCRDVAVVPLLWVLPLALYLLTFIVCFGRPAWYRRLPAAGFMFAALVAVTWLLHQDFDDDVALPVQVLVYSVVVLACCFVMHGELYRLRPASRGLTGFYLAIAAGGALGGLLVNLVAPLLFDGYWEFHLGLLGSVILLGWLVHRGYRNLHAKRARAWRAVWTLACAGFACALGLHVHAYGTEAIGAERSFYGVLRVYQREGGGRGAFRELYHGRILHGAQYLDPRYRRQPSSYYGPSSGVWVAVGVQRLLASQRTGSPALRIGVIGEGAAAFAAHGRKGDSLRFYELDPAVDRIARRHFTYLEDTPAAISVVYGDVRVSLAHELREGSQAFDLLVVDAFSGDGIPVHLLTTEAMTLYRRHLAVGGVIAFHISNRYFDLLPVVRGLAEDAGLGLARIASEGAAPGESASDWVLLSAERNFLTQIRAGRAAPNASGASVLWTDDYANVLEVLLPGTDAR